jgi:hypothetical protein
LGDDRAVDHQPELREIEREYEREREADAASGTHRSLADDALTVVLEWGPQARLSQGWRLERRQPTATAAERQSALTDAAEVKHLAYDLTAPAWPHVDGRVPAPSVEDVEAVAITALERRFPELDSASLRRAVRQANYIHAK